jgi:hypothetical protein
VSARPDACAENSWCWSADKSRPLTFRREVGPSSAGGSERLYVPEGLHEPILLYFQARVSIPSPPLNGPVRKPHDGSPARHFIQTRGACCRNPPGPSEKVQVTRA